MKKLSILFFAILMVMSVNAQNEHLKFKGVPMDGTLNSFVDKLKTKGLNYEGTHEGVAMLSGDFAGYKSCLIYALAPEPRKVVSKAGVIFPEMEKWEDLEKAYMILKSMLTTKYGEPKDVVEEFQGYSTPDSDISKLHALRYDRCKYSTSYETPQGKIVLSLSQRNNMSCFVVLEYYDEINTESVKANAIDDL